MERGWPRGASAGGTWQPALLRAVLTCFILVTCGGPAAAPPDPLAGSYAGVGSTTTLDNAKLVTAAFSKLHPARKFQLNVTDTETSIVKVGSDDLDADFGFIGREPKASEGVLSLTPMGSTGSAFAVNASNKVRALTRAQLQDILTGRISDWSQLGGAGPIKVLLREPKSHTRLGLEKYVFGTDPPSYTATAFTTTDTNAASAEMLDALKSFAGSIGMVTLDSMALANRTIVLVEMDGIAPTLQNLAAAKWPVRRPAFLSTTADPAKVKPAIKALVEFIKSAEGQRALAGQ